MQSLPSCCFISADGYLRDDAKVPPGPEFGLGVCGGGHYSEHCQCRPLFSLHIRG